MKEEGIRKKMEGETVGRRRVNGGEVKYGKNEAEGKGKREKEPRG